MCQLEFSFDLFDSNVKACSSAENLMMESLIKPETAKAEASQILNQQKTIKL